MKSNKLINHYFIESVGTRGHAGHAVLKSMFKMGVVKGGFIKQRVRRVRRV